MEAIPPFDETGRDTKTDFKIGGGGAVLKKPLRFFGVLLWGCRCRCRCVVIVVHLSALRPCLAFVLAFRFTSLPCVILYEYILNILLIINPKTSPICPVKMQFQNLVTSPLGCV